MLFDPILQGKNLASQRSLSLEIIFIIVHGILFTSQPLDSLDHFDKAVEKLDTGDLCVSKTIYRFKETGVCCCFQDRRIIGIWHP